MNLFSQREIDDGAEHGSLAAVLVSPGVAVGVGDGLLGVITRSRNKRHPADRAFPGDGCI